MSLIRIESSGKNPKYDDLVRSHATAALRELNSKTGDALLIPVTFIIAMDKADFDLLAGGGSEHALAVALGAERKVIINYQLMAQSASDQIRQVLVHELAHIFLDVKCDGPVPRWLHEGIAQEVAGESIGPGRAELAIAAYTGGLIPLKDLIHSFPSSSARRELAYAEGLSVVRFLISEDYGNSLIRFLSHLTEDKSALLKSLSGGIELDSVNLRWRQDLKSPISIFSIILSNGFFWGLMAVLVILAYLAKRRKSRLIHQEWEREEALGAEFESIHDRIDRFDEDLESYLIENEESPAGFEPEETPYDRYLREEEDRQESDWR